MSEAIRIIDRDPAPLRFPEDVMQTQQHTINQLFSQLGLADEPAAVDAFIAAHRPLPNDIALYRAPFWSSAQREFLKQEIIEDADWAPVIDELNTRLR